MRALAFAAVLCCASGLALPRARTRPPSHVALRGGGRQYVPMPETARRAINLGTTSPVLSACCALGGPRLSRVAVDVLLHYAATILTFISGIWWGCLLKGTPTKSHTGVLVYAIAVALASNAVAATARAPAPCRRASRSGASPACSACSSSPSRARARAVRRDHGRSRSDDKPASALVRMRKWPMFISVVSLARGGARWRG